MEKILHLQNKKLESAHGALAKAQLKTNSLASHNPSEKIREKAAKILIFQSEPLKKQGSEGRKK